jgi:hypothetical protein
MNSGSRDGESVLGIGHLHAACGFEFELFRPESIQTIENAVKLFRRQTGLLGLKPEFGELHLDLVQAIIDFMGIH